MQSMLGRAVPAPCAHILELSITVEAIAGGSTGVPMLPVPAPIQSSGSDRQCQLATHIVISNECPGETRLAQGCSQASL